MPCARGWVGDRDRDTQTRAHAHPTPPHPTPTPPPALFSLPTFPVRKKERSLIYVFLCVCACVCVCCWSISSRDIKSSSYLSISPRALQHRRIIQMRDVIRRSPSPSSSQRKNLARIVVAETTSILAGSTSLFAMSVKYQPMRCVSHAIPG